MAEQDPKVESDEEQESTNYKKPAEKALGDILSTDAEDESLRKYKEQLLGADATKGSPIIVFPNNPSTVIVKSMTFISEGRDDIVLELYKENEEEQKKHLEELKKQSFKIKEGASYRIKITFWVQRELVSGLKYVQKTKRKGINVDRMDVMVGSYGPKTEEQSFTAPVEEAPSGLLARGSYNVKSKFTDDDAKNYLTWDWKFELSSKWD